MKILGYDINFSKAVNVVDKTTPKKSKISSVIPYEQALIRVRQDIDKWRNGIRQAESIQYPNRYLLYQTYKDVVLDAHLSGAIQQRTLNAIGGNWCLQSKEGVLNEEKTELLNKYWFEKFLEYSVESLFWGHSLIQLGDLENDEFKNIELVPRHYVKPEYHVVTPTTASYTGIDYLEEPYSDWCIGVGECRDLGLLMKASPYVIWKKNTTGSWAEHAEIFGSPIRIGKTNVRDEITRKNMENMLKNMGSAAWGVFDPDDNIEMLQMSGRDAYRIYEHMIDYCNKEISKLILGVTMTMDDGASRSQGEVHERVVKQVEESDKKFIESVVNGKLIPLLNIHGFGLENLRFKFVEADNLSLEEQAKVDVELLKYYNIDPSYIAIKYGTPVENKVEEKTEENNVDNIQSMIKSAYV